MKGWFRDFLRDEAGVSVLEFALVTALVGLVTAGILVTLEETLCDIFQELGNAPPSCP